MNEVLNIFFFAFFYLLLIWKAGRTYPILYLFMFTYFLQYLFSTYLIYNDFETLYSQMPIGQDKYFSYAIPALAFLFAGVIIFNRDIDITSLLKRIDIRQAEQLAFILLISSYFIDLLIRIGVPLVGSIGSFTTYLKYSSAFCFLFTSNRFRYFIIGVIYLELAYTALQIGIFINFFIWSTYLFFFITLIFNVPFWLRVTFIFVAAPILFLVQSVKNDYREATWEKQQGAGIGLLYDLAEKNSEKEIGNEFTETKGVTNTVARLTQGWHLALTLKHVPKKEPLAYGNEMLDDIVASVLPRIFFSNKKTTGSQKKFTQYTGHRLYGNTSMTIGVLGDFYINYGVWGSYIGLFIFGSIIAKLLHYFVVHYVVPDPINIVYVPYLLNYLVRAGNDFYTVFNCLVKGFLIFLFMNYLRKRIWPVNTTPQKLR